MDIFGLDAVTATLVFTGVDLVLQNVVGWLKNAESFNIRQAAASGIIAFFGSAVIVGGVIGAIPEDTDQLAQLTTIATVIAAVSGFDTLIKNGARAITAKTLN